MINRRGFFALAAAGASTALAACSTGSSDDKSSNSASGSGSAAASGFPVTIKHAFGETKVTKAPSKVVVVGWSDADICASLGVVPAAMPATSFGGNANKSTDWFDAKVKELGGKTPVMLDTMAKDLKEKVAEVGPDLILGTNSGLTKAQYDELSKIAPVVAYPKLPYGTDWQQSTSMVAQALGKVDEGKKVVADTEKKVSDAVAKYPELKGKSVSWIYFTATAMNTVGLYTDIDSRTKLLKEMGFGVGSKVAKDIQNQKAAFVSLSAEKASDIDSDIVIYNTGMDVTEDKVKASPLFAKIPAMKKGAVAVVDLTTATALGAPSPLSLPAGLDKLLPKLAEAAKKA